MRLKSLVIFLVVCILPASVNAQELIVGEEDAIAITEALKDGKRDAALRENLEAQVKAKDQTIEELRAQIANLELVAAKEAGAREERSKTDTKLVQVLERADKTIERLEKRVESLENRIFWTQITSIVGLALLVFTGGF